ncbi:fucose isomerase [Bacteroidia bacterium]|nr:fucose isomerase [Bacteroidia bacterium]
MKLKVLFLPNARLTFSQPDAEAKMTGSRELLARVFGEVIAPEGLLTSPEMVGEEADRQVAPPDLVVYQTTTFIGADFMAEITRRFDCPIVVWSVREPSIDGGRLKLNSLTGAFSAANILLNQRRGFEFVFGDPDEKSVITKFTAICKARSLVESMRRLTIGMVGSQPAGFAFGAIDDALLGSKFGIRVLQTEAADIMRDAAGMAPEAYEGVLKEFTDRTRGWDKTPAENLDKYARLRKAYQNFIDNNKIGAIASRCWPDFFTGFGAPVCGVLSMLNDNGIPSSCEADLGGVVSMVMGRELTDSAVYFGDPVAVDESCDGIVFWHCGAGASCLARKSEGAGVGVHPNRKIGPTMEMGLKAGEVTVLRLGKTADGFRIFAMRGQALDEPQKFWGTSVTVRPAGGGAAAKVAEMVGDGWEPHFIVAYGDIMEELRLVSTWLDIELWEY